MTPFELLSLIIALIALVISIWATIKSNKIGVRQNQLQEQLLGLEATRERGGLAERAYSALGSDGRNALCGRIVFCVGNCWGTSSTSPVVGQKGFGSIQSCGRGIGNTSSESLRFGRGGVFLMVRQTKL
jgi:hypothetical protein